MATVEGPRLATDEEIDDVFAFVDRVFNNDRGGFRTSNPHSFDPGRPHQHAVITVDGEVASHVGCTPQTFVAPDVEVECWGITGVATARRHRGNGYMTDLLRFWHDRMDAADVPLATLYGDRFRYRHYHYELAGRQRTFPIAERMLPGEVPRGVVRRYEGDPDDRELVRRLREAEPYRVRREERLYDPILTSRGRKTMVYDDGNAVAYATINRAGASKSFREFGGDRDGIEGLLAHVFEAYDTTPIPTFRGGGGDGGVRVTCHPRHPLVPYFDRISSGTEVHPHQMLRILDLRGLLTAYAGQLERRWRRSSDDRTGALTLAIEEEGGSTGATTVSYGPDGIDVGPSDAAPDVSLDRAEMVRLLFGFPADRHDLKRNHGFLEATLPLEFYVAPTDMV